MRTPPSTCVDLARSYLDQSFNAALVPIQSKLLINISSNKGNLKIDDRQLPPQEILKTWKHPSKKEQHTIMASYIETNLLLPRPLLLDDPYSRRFGRRLLRPGLWEMTTTAVTAARCLKEENLDNALLNPPNWSQATLVSTPLLLHLRPSPQSSDQISVLFLRWVHWAVPTVYWHHLLLPSPNLYFGDITVITKDVFYQ